MSDIHNIAGYKFVTLTELAELRSVTLEKCIGLGVKGTILLSSEGINIGLAALPEAIHEFKQYLLADDRFADMTFRESFSKEQPFRRMKVKLRKEIITMRQPDVQPELARAPSISPREFKQWLDENKDIAVLDTRNDYEVQFGTFANAINLQMKDFSEFPEKSKELAKDKPIVMFCTGGIRCEKAGVYLLNSGFEKVYQLEGGILNYFTEVGGDHYDGECFVFDGRVALDSNLKSTGAQQCCVCQQPVQPSSNHMCSN
jgi:UPF0176 protein